MYTQPSKGKPKVGKKPKEPEAAPAPSVLDDCRRHFRAELRHAAAALSAAASAADAQRQRGRLRALLADLRRSAVAFAARASPPPAARSAASAPSLARPRGKSPAAEAQTITAATTAAAAAAVTTTTTAAETKTAAPERSLDLATAVVFAEECVAAAALLAARGMHEEVVDIVCDMLERDVRMTLRDAVWSVVADSTPPQVQFPSVEKDTASDVTLAPVTSMGRRARMRLLDPVSQRNNTLLTQTQRILTQYEMLRHASQFYLAFQASGDAEGGSKLVLSSIAHIEAVTTQMTALAETDADDSYYVIFNCTVTLYEMCLHLTRRAEAMGKSVQGVLDDVLGVAARTLALCIEMCESATLKLSTVRYLPWRLRLYEFLASCYERQGFLAEALTIAQRSAQKVWDLVDIEFLDPVLPPQASRDTMHAAIDQTVLDVLRYTWLMNNTTGQTTEKNAGVTANTHTSSSSGAPPSKAPPSSLPASLLQRVSGFPISELPRNAFDMVDRAWQLLLRMELPRRPPRALVSPVQQAAGESRGKESKDQANNAKPPTARNPSERAAVAERVFGSLIRFLLAFATASSTTTTVTPETSPLVFPRRSDALNRTTIAHAAAVRPLHVWAANALEHLMHHAVYRYVLANPTAAAGGSAEDFLEEELPPPPLPPLDPALEATGGPNKKGAASASNSRRSNKQSGAAAAAAAQTGRTIHALEDEVFVKSMTLEAFLRRVAPPNIPLWKAPTTSTSGEVPDEENQLLSFMLHRVMYDGRNTHLFGRLCTCTIECLKKWREDDARLNAGTSSSNPPKHGTPVSSPTARAPAVVTSTALSRRATLHRMSEAYIIGLRVLQRMQRVALKAEPCIGDLAIIAGELRQLAGMYGGGASISAGAKSATSSHHKARRPPVADMPSASSSFAFVHQWLLEEGADFLHRRVNRCAPTQPNSRSLQKESVKGNEKGRDYDEGSKTPMTMTTTTTATKDKLKEKEQADGEKKEASESNIMKEMTQAEEEDVSEPKESACDMYHDIVHTYLEAKVSSGLTDAAGIGRLVLAYAQEVENDVSVSDETHDDSDLGKTARELRRKRNCAANAISAVQIALSCIAQRLTRASSSALTTSAPGQPTSSVSVSSGVTTTKSSGGAPMKSSKRGGGFTVHNQQLVSSEKSSACFATRSEDDRLSAAPVASSISAINTGSPGTVENDMASHRNELELRDTQTELTCWLVRLQWHHAAHRQRLAALRRYRADVQTLLTRQANAHIYGVTSAKEANILRALQREGPEKPRVSDEEKTRLLSWAHDEGDELLPALVHICLAPYQPHTKAQREMIEEALHILQRYESRRATVAPSSYAASHDSAGLRHKPAVSRLTARSMHEDSKYSALMIWCYVIVTCGQLGFTGMAQSAKDVLYAVFAKSDTSGSVEHRACPYRNDRDTAEEKQTKAQKDSEEMFDENGVSTYAVQPNEEVLAVSSPLLVRTLVSALLWISTADMQRQSYENFDVTGLVPFTGRSVLLDVPFTGRYGFARPQRLYMQNAYRLQFAIELAALLQANELVLECAFELFNALLPTLMDANYCSLVLQPLATLCMALLRQPDTVWADTHVQLLAARTLKAVLRTAQKMEQAPLSETRSSPQQQQSVQSSSIPAVTNATMGKTGNVQILNLSEIKSFVTVPDTAAGWYELLIRTFVHVWTRVYTCPNSRQLRHIAYVRKRAGEVHRILSSYADATAVQITSPTRSRMSARARSRTTSPREEPAWPGASGPFPCSGFVSLDSLVDDSVPIELLELLDLVLFVVPGGATVSTQLERTAFSNRRTTAMNKQSLTATSATAALPGVPTWITEVSRLLATRSIAPALERLQQASDDPLYAKTAAHVVEFLLRNGDVPTAQRVATDALQQIQKQHDAVQQHQETVLERMKSWLQREGYVFTASAATGPTPSRGARDNSTQRSSEVKGQSSSKTSSRARKNGKASKEYSERGEGGASSAALSGEAGAGAAPLGETRHWTVAEQQMLRQLTRGFAWLRCRRAFFWLRSRFMQLTSPYQAQLRLYLSAIGQLTIERRRHQSQNEAEQQPLPSTSRANTSRSGRSRLAESEATSGTSGEAGSGETEEERRSMDDAARAAVLFNRCGFPSRAFAAVSLAYDGLRVRVCAEASGAPSPGSVLFGLPLHSSSETAELKSFAVPDSSGGDGAQCLAQWSPLAQRLAEAAAAALSAVWTGASDARRDAALLQPPAVRVGRDAAALSALRFAGRVPALTVAATEVGKHAEALGDECGLPAPVRLDNAGAMKLLARRLGAAIPARAAATQLAFLIRIVQYARPLAAERIATETYQATGGLFAAELLPIALGIRQCIGGAVEQHALSHGADVVKTVDLREAYARVDRDAPEYRVRLQGAHETWNAYVATDACRRALLRLSRTLLPTDRKFALMVEGDTESMMSPPSQGANESMVSTVTALSSHAGTRVVLRNVISTYAAATAHLRERRLFGLLAECLCELGHVHLLHRQRAEASRCWREAADAALGVPESLRQPAATWLSLPIETVGLPRVLLAVLALTSIAMFSCREQQHMAVDACLLAARVIERLLSDAGGATSGFPRRLRDYGSFMFDDLIVLPHLGGGGDTLPRLMPRVVQHMLFLAGELLRCRMPLYACMVASLTVYLARTHTRHVGIVVEAQLVQAVAAARCGSQRAAMRALRDVCGGARLPCAALDGTNIFMRPAVECLDGPDSGGAAARGGKSNKKAMNPSSTATSTPLVSSPGVGGSAVGGDDTADRGVISPLQDYEGLYCDTELPTATANASCVPTFVSQCFRPSTASAPASGFNYGSGAGSADFGGLADAVVARYGRHLSHRVELAVADALLTLGVRESAYTWTAHAAPASVPSPLDGGSRRGGGGPGGGGSGTRMRSLQRMPLHRFTTSAAVDALAAAEQIALGLLQRVGPADAAAAHAGGEAPATAGKGSRSVRPSAGSAATHAALPQPLPVGRDAEEEAARKGRETQVAYVRGVAEMLLARVYVARGEYTRALVVLQGLVTSMETAGPAAPVPGTPSFLWTLATHSFVCETYELMAMSHLRLREYAAARKVVQEALAICEQCRDPYAARVFSLYAAAIAARRGDVAEARDKLDALHATEDTIATDARVDWTHAWIILAGESLRRIANTSCKSGNNKNCTDATERLETAVSTLRVYCEANGLPPASRLLRSPPPRPLIAWCVETVLLHHSINALAAEHMRHGRPNRAAEYLREAIAGLTTQYDTLAHPTPLLESQLLLARALFQMDPTLLMPFQQQQEQQKPQQLQLQQLHATPFNDEPVSEKDVFLALDERRRELVELLLNVANQVVSNGTHDYDALRLALLLLSVLLARAGHGFRVMAGTCALLARLVEDMKLHVFSATSVFGLYGDDAIVLGGDVSFNDTVIATIQSTQRGLGHTAERGPAPPALLSLSRQQSPDAKRVSPSTTREKPPPRPTAPLPTVIAAFAALHRERAVQHAAPPLESLDLETALCHVRAFLQLRTAPPSFAYQWYADAVREAHVRQPQPPSGGRLGGPRGTAAGSPGSAAEAPASLLPPIVMDALPAPLETATLSLLCIPRANTVVSQSFVRDAPREPPSVLFVLVLSPVHDPAVTQPPPLGERVLQTGRKVTRAERGAERGAWTEKSAASRNSAAEGKTNPVTTPDGASSSDWNATQCVVFELPLDEVLALRAHAERALKLMQNLFTTNTPVPAEPAAGGEVSVSSALSQQLGDAFALLAAKSAAATTAGGGRKAAGMRDRNKEGEFTPTTSALAATAVPTSSLHENSNSKDKENDKEKYHNGNNNSNSGNAGPALDEAKAQLALGFVEALVRAVVPRVVADDELMERYVQGLLPRCAVSIEVVRFMRSMLVRDGGATSLFNPGLYEWFARIATFTAEHA